MLFASFLPFPVRLKLAQNFKKLLTVAYNYFKFNVSKVEKKQHEIVSDKFY